MKKYRTISIATFCTELLGYREDETCRGGRYRSLVSPNGECILTRDTPYPSFYSQGGVTGEILDLLLHVEGMPRDQALDLLNNYIGENSPKHHHEQKHA